MDLHVAQVAKSCIHQIWTLDKFAFR